MSLIDFVAFGTPYPYPYYTPYQYSQPYLNYYSQPWYIPACYNIIDDHSHYILNHRLK